MAELTPKMQERSRFEGLGQEIVKVVYMFSIVSEILACILAAYTKDMRYTPLVLLLLLVPVYSVIMCRLLKSFFLFFLNFCKSVFQYF